MTTFAPTFTPRWKGTYRAGGIEHSLTLRGARGATFATMDGYRDRAREMFADVAADLYSDFSWVKAEVALTDSDIFLPATTPTVVVPGVRDRTLFSAARRIKALTFSGNSLDGRGRFSLFGIVIDDGVPAAEGADGLVLPAEKAYINTIVDRANTYFYGAGGLLCNWHRRGTYKANDHLLKLVRRGTIT